jgi:ubiquinone/menaquinone biosynthesis C-methylase UbiE
MNGQMKFENPARLQELNPAETLLRIGLQNGQVVCDIGAGSGIFTIPAALMTDQAVIALEINEELIPIIIEKACSQGLSNIQAIKVQGSNFTLQTGSVDLVLLVTVFHEIDDKALFHQEVWRILNDYGKVAVIEFHKRETPMGPPLPHRISQDAILAHFADSGFYLKDKFQLFNFY